MLQQLSEERREEFSREMAANWATHNRGDDKRTLGDAEYLEVYVRPN